MAASKAASQYPTHHTGDPRSTHFRNITLGRLDRFEGGEYADINLTSALYEDRADDGVTMQVWDAPGRTKPTFAEAVRARGYRTLRKGDSFGPIWTNHWVKMTIKVPQSWSKYERVQLEFDPSCEAMIFNDEGLPLQGITGGYGGDRRVEYLLDEKARKFAHHLYIEVTCNGMFGLDAFEGDRGYDSRTFRLNSADLVAPRQEAWHLLWDFRTIKELAKVMPDQSPLQHTALAVANNITNIFRYDDLSTIALCRKEARKVLGRYNGSEVYKSDGDNKPQVWAIGNCHIDTAWLWPFAATQQKTARSWSTQLDLMERYPEHRFVASQAQQFKWLEKQYPSLFDKIKEKVSSGQFQPIGGCWVEMDTNLPSGEALCRQMIFGQRYFKSRFGKYCETLWLPDTFGYSCQLPQIARLAGMENFFTQKLSWSQFNTFPHTTFSWVGIDGSQVLTHMPPVNTYTAQATVNDVRVSVSTHKSLESSDLAILPFGNGDGGGGPLAPMLESLRRIRGAAETSRDIPKVVLGNTVDDFFRQILSTSNSGKDFATWIGELYFEYHRGTYTSHGSIKNHNRRSEILMRDVEMAATLASLFPSADSKERYVYPKEEIDSLWEDLLLCQFHDVLPGSAIEMVYRDAEAIYHNIAVKGHALLQKALLFLHPASTDKLTSPQPLSTYYALNTANAKRSEIVATKGVATTSALAQAIGKDGHLVLFSDDNGSGVATPRMVNRTDGEPRIQVKNDEFILHNDRISITVTAKGRISSILDLRQNRELVDKSATGGFVLYDDTPNAYDAWDADIGHLEKAIHLEGEVMPGIQGPLRSSLLLRFKYKESVIETTISLDHSSVETSESGLGLLRFTNHVHWNAKHVFLKFELPTTVRSDSAIYDVQFGTLSRPTHRNTTWDQAKFEVCGHKFADLSEFGYGIAIVNNNKYGYAVANNVMRLSLLRGATYPDRHQDEGSHLFDFAIYPHACHFMQSDVPQVARNFNAPFHVRRRAANAHAQSLAAMNPISLKGSPNMVLETIKRGDDDDFISHKSQSVILRIFDAYGGSGNGELHLTFPVKKAAIVDLLERDICELKVSTAENASNARIPIAITAFQILTVKLTIS